MTPHSPYLPDAADRGRFLPNAEPLALEEESWAQFGPHYESTRQGLVNRCRLAYDEFVATADRAFGTFMSELENDGKLSDTTVIVSADHGESFEGGVYQHDSPYLTRPVVHIPLIIRTPDQQESRTVAVTADQTSLAPTILELAGQPKPDSMRGESLVEWLHRDGQGGGLGLAYTQYLAKKSPYNPRGHETVGVIDGHYEYVVDVVTQKGVLRPLSEAHLWNLDRSAEYPERAAASRAAILSRFPDLVQKPT
jgi:arylsulfatase A-like enzyme